MKRFFDFVLIAMVVVLSFIVPGQTNAQEAKGTIDVKNSFWSNSYFIEDKEYTRAEIKDILENDNHTKDIMKTSNSKRAFGFVALVGGAIFTLKTIVSIYHSEYNYNTFPTNNSDSDEFLLSAGLGIGLDIIGTVLVAGGNNAFHRAIKTYNNSLTFSNDIKVDFGICMNRVGLTVHF